MRNGIRQFAATGDILDDSGDRSDATSVLDGDQIKHIDCNVNREDNLAHGLDSAAAEEEEDDELEEEDEVRRAAELNRN